MTFPWPQPQTPGHLAVALVQGWIESLPDCWHQISGTEHNRPLSWAGREVAFPRVQRSGLTYASFHFVVQYSFLWPDLQTGCLAGRWHASLMQKENFQTVSFCDEIGQLFAPNNWKLSSLKLNLISLCSYVVIWLYSSRCRSIIWTSSLASFLFHHPQIILGKMSLLLKLKTTCMYQVFR